MMLGTFRICFVFSLLIVWMGMPGASDSLAQVGLDSPLWQFTEDSEHHRSIVQVSSQGGVGTGVIVLVDKEKPVEDGYQGYCLTAYHVVENDQGRRDVSVTYQSGRRSSNCMVVASDEKNDVALVWVWVPPGVVSAKVASQPMIRGQYLEIAGLGGGSKLECCLRHFQTSTTYPTNNNTIFADVSLLPGDSGGPAFNEQREVVGVVSGGWFWFDGDVKDGNGNTIKPTWPARLCNVAPIQKLLAQLVD